MALRRIAAVLLPAALWLAVAAAQAGAHAGLTKADPLPGATLGAGPTAIRLTFTERPAPSLSTVTVAGPGGAPVQEGSPKAAPGDPLTLVQPVRQLGRGAYTVAFKTVSAVDGHGTTGSYSFGIQVSAKGGGVTSNTTKPSTSKLEFFARWTLLIGLVLLIGAAVAGAAGYGGTTGSDARLAASGWLAAGTGVLLLVVAQRRTADSSLGALLGTPVGHALIWRAVSLGAAGAALLVARSRPMLRRPALLAAALAALATVTFHVANGHAAAGSWPHALTVLAQVAHFAAAGIWIGGLAALVLSLRGAASADMASAVRRFSLVAACAVAIVVVTGTVRAVDELSSLDDLFDTGYGRAVLAKIVLMGLLAALGWRQRQRSVTVAATDLGPLRRTSRLELVLAAGALAAAALLGTLAPPVTGQPSGAVAGLSVSGTDFATTTRVKLTAASAEPGQNAFVAHAEDYDSHDPIRGARVSLRFTPLDDPGVDATSLALRPRADGDYTGNGPNLTFDGRWRVTTLVQRGSQAVEVPLELDVKGPDQSVSILRAPGQPHEYTMQVGNLGYIQISPRPDRAGLNRVYLVFFDVFENRVPVAGLVITAQAGDGPVRQVPVRRVTPRRYEADMGLKAGSFHVAVVARTLGDARLRGVFDLDVPK